MIEKSEIIAQRLRELRRRLGLSQAELGKKCSLSTQYICQIETGKRIASLSALIKICDALEVPMTTLFCDVPSSKHNYANEIAELLNDCSNREQKIIFDTLLSLKKSMKEN